MTTPKLLGIPSDWDDERWITFEEFCKLFDLPQRTVRDWRRRGIGPHWTRFPGTGRLYIQVREARRYPAGNRRRPPRSAEVSTNAPTEEQS